jgi:REP element-mobilizing transposase RayT
VRNPVSEALREYKKPGFCDNLRIPTRFSEETRFMSSRPLTLICHMPRRQVILQAGNYYHVYNRGNNRQLIFFERENYIYFLRQLRNHLITHGVDIIAYCLMPNHYHLLVYLKTNRFSNLMQSFTLSYTKAIAKRYQRVGSLFQGRFEAIHVDTEEYLLHLTRYIHLNPVSAKIVQKAEDWEFSSYQEYIDLRQGSLPKIDGVRSQFHSADAYRYFLEDLTSDKLIQHLTFEE